MGQSCGNRQITGASFSIHPMSDDFVTIIHEALDTTNTSNVWLKTDDVSTVVRGKAIHVFDVTTAICAYAAKNGKHLAFQATYSIGCPGDGDSDYYLPKENTLLNGLTKEEIGIFAAAKFSLYPLGASTYMETIGNQIEAMKKYVHVSKAHYSTKLEGNLIDIFHGLENVFQATVDAGSEHTVMTVAMSIHSPSHEKYIDKENAN